MKRYDFILLITSFFIFINGCSKYDDSDLRDRLNSLNNRVVSIETALEVMNNEINAISSLADVLQQRLYVSDVKTTDNGYTLTFSDGSKVVISHGEDGKKGKDAPLIGVRYFEGRYYWAQTTDGVTDWLKDVKGNLIPASGLDGITPQIKVDSDGYWIISYDNGYNFVTLTDDFGNPIKASAEDGVSFFDSVGISNNEIRITLKDGSEIILYLGEIPPLKAVDLGLSVKWASFNMGASSETDSGELYYWGDPDNSGGNNYEAPTVNNICGTIYDIARKKWGGTWRIPNEQEQKELIFYCTWKRVTINGVQGMRITSRNGNSIFLPPTGYRINYSQRNEMENGYYWVGETYRDESKAYAYVYYFNATSYYYNGGWVKNGTKLAIRPVKE
ncbi:MAG: DUF4988 domain-containing protein [Porphyromonadaceae bacterium]|nr:DUF4988 domain-containing protein [Porphyromonadaceae bacterium]